MEQPVPDEMMREIELYNTLGRQVEPLCPLEPGTVRLYTCGPTVYDYAHIGNLRTFLFEDILRRSLNFLGLRVTQVMNLTDVDDKTIQGAHERSVSLDEHTGSFIDSFFEDLDALHIERAEHYPRATGHITEMIELVESLVERGNAYIEEGSVFFRIASDPEYGKLSGFDLNQVRQGRRVASDEYGKEDARDFALWKKAKPGEPWWDSPWGPGRPGWHIECSAMSMRYLGETFDIHCGGVDNIFPHHENEIAQSESATGKPFARMWLHSEHLLVDGEKMSKSLGNFHTLRDLLARGEDPRAIRYLLLSVHYRQKLNFTTDALRAASGALHRLDEMRFRLLQAAVEGPARQWVREAVDRLREDFSAALADDLNLSAALGALFGFVKRVNLGVEAGELGEGDRERLAGGLEAVDRVLGVLDPEAWTTSAAEEQGLGDELIRRLVDERSAARRERDFQRADRIREELARLGVTVEDTPRGSRLKRM